MRYVMILLWCGDWLVVWMGYGVFRGKLGGFAVAAPQEFQGLRQLVQGLWAELDGFVVQNPC